MCRSLVVALSLLFIVSSVPDVQAEDGWVQTESGLKYQVLQEGKGSSPTKGDRVTVHYTGTLTDGTKFDSSRDRGQPFSFTLGMREVIEGWDVGVALMKRGSRFKLHIPWKMAYGANGRPPRIPPKADLLFDVELIDFVSPLRFTRPEGDSVQTLEGGTRVQILKQGTGRTPTPEDGVSLRIALFNDKGMQVFSTDRAGGSFGGQLKGLRLANQDLPFFRPLIRRMKVGEVLTAEVPAKQAFGTNTPDARVIPADGKTVWLLELESINEIPAFVMPTADQLKTTASGLQYQMLEEGSGKKPGPGSVVEVHYTGYLTDGTIFDSSHARGTPAQFPVGGVIRGWTEGLQLMKEGGVYRFVIPAKLAYGSEQRGAFIKPNSTLVFLVKLVKVVR